VNANSAPEAARIGRRITALRRERGWSLNELAGRAGVGKATLSGVEAGTRNPTLETLYAIAGQLGLPLAAVLADPRDGVEAVSTVHGTAVTAELLAVFNEPTAVFEYYRVLIKPSLRQTSPAHVAGTTEHLTVYRGIGYVGTSHTPLKVMAGSYATWNADEPHIFEADEDIHGALLIRYPSAA